MVTSVQTRCAFVWPMKGCVLQVLTNFRNCDIFLQPTALSLQCYDCSSLAQVSGGTSCSADNVKKVTCPPIYDRCFTMKFSTTPEVTFEMRNCSSSLVCDAQSDFNRK